MPRDSVVKKMTLFNNLKNNFNIFKTFIMEIIDYQIEKKISLCKNENGQNILIV